MQGPPGSYLGRVALAVGVLALAAAAWQAQHVALLLFGGLIVAAVLHALARRLARLTGLGHKVAVALSVLLLVLLGLALLWWVGDSVAAQVQALRERLPQAGQAARRWLQDQPFGEALLQLFNESFGQDVPWQRLLTAAGATLGVVGELVLVLLIGVFVAAEPGLYKRGVVRLVSPAVRGKLAGALDACAGALGDWLKGQAVSMLFVGVATGVGLALLGMPLALTLGLVAALLDFVPFFGPIAAGVLAVLVAFTEGPQMALYVGLLMLAIQQVEGNLLIPLVQRWAVSLPPMLGVVAVVVFAAWFGIAGIVLATPLMVVLLVLVRTLYVEGYLEANG